MSTAPSTVSITITANTRPWQVEIRKAWAGLRLAVMRRLEWPDDITRNAAITDARDTLAMAVDAAEGIR